MTPGKRAFIPALTYDVLTPLYDVAIRLTLPEIRFKRCLLAAAGIGAGQRALDIGCGTGTLLRLAAQSHPDAEFVGLDPDPNILTRARKKLRRFPNVDLNEGSATALPYPASTFDRVLSSLVFHHLSGEQKVIAFQEILRVLRPRGELHLADFGAPHTPTMRVLSILVETIGREHVTENFRGLLPAMLSEAGFHEVGETARFATIFGTIQLLKGTRT
jgi:ubiquinone/menaquinone biosynthesis C-methylase UbiE